MKSLEQEAKEYANKYTEDSYFQAHESFLAGARSNWARRKEIQSVKDALESVLPFVDEEEYRETLQRRIAIGDKLLKEIEDENT